jgi:hypothetical protein
MRVKQILISTELISQFFEKGNIWGENEVITCEEGLPAGAKLIYADFASINTVRLLFQHDSFDEIEYELYYDTPGIPVITPIYSMRLKEAK